jgi:hypothetical protein
MITAKHKLYNLHLTKPTCLQHGIVSFQKVTYLARVPLLQWCAKLLFWYCKHDIGKTTLDFM